jgi:hypothetical protein
MNTDLLGTVSNHQAAGTRNLRPAAGICLFWVGYEAKIPKAMEKETAAQTTQHQYYSVCVSICGFRPPQLPRKLEAYAHRKLCAKPSEAVGRNSKTILDLCGSHLSTGASK